MNPTNPPPDSLRVLISNGRPERLEEVAQTISNLGHRAIAIGADVISLGKATIDERPDVAIVVVGEGTRLALEMIGKMVREATCPVIALLDVEDPSFIKEAAKRGVFAYITSGHPDELRSSLDIVLRRFAEYHNLEGAFSRRAVSERAKGILMERHDVGEDEAFGMLRDKARQTDRKVVDVAEAVVLSRGLLPDHSPTPAPNREQVASESEAT